ncbi:MAG: hypothetical protein ACRDTT_26330, partial [Pseudonocardiaceae bacterium]
DDVPAARVREHLSQVGINTSVSAATSARFDPAAREPPELVRASVHYYNTDDEIDQLCDALRRPWLSRP